MMQAKTELSKAALGSVPELESPPFRAFMDHLNEFAAQHGMRVFRDWSKVWEYPWLWYNGLAHTALQGLNIVDLGSELSPMPWFLASQGARLVLFETDAQWTPQWIKWREKLAVDVDWRIVPSETLPLPDASADVVTSFSVIEHQPAKERAVAEAVRILKPDGMLAISFDICQPELGMTFPEWNGTALTLREMETWLWLHPAFGNPAPPVWNTDDMAAFRQWNLKSAPHHNYVVGAAVLRKLSSPY
jgi:SAM-dependent methyltransferase